MVFKKKTLKSAYTPFTPLIIPGNTRTSRITAAAGTHISRSYQMETHYVILCLWFSSYDLIHMRCHSVTLSSIAEDS